MAHRDVARIKGGKTGLSLVIDDHADMASIIDVLRDHVNHSPAFFRGASLRLETSGRVLTDQELAELAAAVGEFGMELCEGETEPPTDTERGRSASDRPESVSKGRRHGGEYGAMDDAAEERSILVKRTLRSGQSVTFDGNVIIRGDVNPGAMVVSSGDIIVLGALRGVAHAGATGDTDAVVIAFRLEPTQLRIAGAISRAPDEQGPRPAGPEIARVRGETIYIEAYHP